MRSKLEEERGYGGEEVGRRKKKREVRGGGGAMENRGQRLRMRRTG